MSSSHKTHPIRKMFLSVELTKAAMNFRTKPEEQWDVEGTNFYHYLKYLFFAAQWWNKVLHVEKYCIWNIQLRNKKDGTRLYCVLELNEQNPKQEFRAISDDPFVTFLTGKEVIDFVFNTCGVIINKNDLPSVPQLNLHPYFQLRKDDYAVRSIHSRLTCLPSSVRRQFWKKIVLPTGPNSRVADKHSQSVKEILRNAKLQFIMPQEKVGQEQFPKLEILFAYESKFLDMHYKFGLSVELETGLFKSVYAPYAMFRNVRLAWNKPLPNEWLEFFDCNLAEKVNGRKLDNRDSLLLFEEREPNFYGAPEDKALDEEELGSNTGDACPSSDGSIANNLTENSSPSYSPNQQFINFSPSISPIPSLPATSSFLSETNSLPNNYFTHSGSPGPNNNLDIATIASTVASLFSIKPSLSNPTTSYFPPTYGSQLTKENNVQEIRNLKTKIAHLQCELDLYKGLCLLNVPIGLKSSF